MTKILVVDDDPAIVRFLKQFLEKKNYQVVTAFDAIDAMEKVKKEVPAVVLLDIEMPVKNGLATLKEIKEYNKDIGVIMISGLESEVAARIALSAGAFDYIVKPFDLDYLEKVLSWKLKMMDSPRT